MYNKYMHKKHRYSLRQGATLGVSVLLPLALVACGSGASSGDAAQTFRRPVDMVVPFGSGGGADKVARTASAEIAKSIDTDVPVINVPGGTGSSGITKMRAEKPGQAMAILIQDTLSTVAADVASFSLKEVRAVCRLQSMPSALFVKKGTYKNWTELAKDAKANPGKLRVATVGTNSVDDIVLAAAKKTQGTSFRAVPFSEPSERYASLLGGKVDVLYEQLGDVRQYLDSGDFVPVVIMSEEKVKGYEEVPLAADIGLPPEVVLPQFRGIVVNPDTSDDVVDALSDACKKAVDTPKFKKFNELEFATDDSYQPADKFQKSLEKEYKLISKQLKTYGIGKK